MKNLIFIGVILSITILANISQATLVEGYFDQSAEDLYRWEKKSNFYGSNYSFDEYICRRQSEEHDFDILFLSGNVTFFQKINTVRSPGNSIPFLINIYVVEFPSKRHVGDQDSTLARSLGQHEFRTPLEHLLGNNTEGGELWPPNDMFVSNARLTESRRLELKASKPALQTTKRRPDQRLESTLRREQRYDPRGRDEKQTGPGPVDSRKTGSTPLLLTVDNDTPNVIESRALRYRFHEFNVNRGYYSDSAQRALGANKRKGFPTLAHDLSMIQQYIPNGRVGVELGNTLRTMDSHPGKIYNSNKFTPVNITSVTPVSSRANNWLTTTTRILYDKSILGKLAQAG